MGALPVGALLVCAGDFMLSCEKGLVQGVEKSGKSSSREEGPLLSAGSWDRTSKVRVGAEDSASVAGELGACSVQDCKDVLCLRDVGAIAEDEWVIVVKTAVSIAERVDDETRVSNRLEKSTDDELSEPRFGVARYA